MRTHQILGTLAATTLASLALTACSTDDEDSTGGDNAGGASVVATTTPLGSVTAQIAECAEGEATTLMPVGADPHDFSASSAQIADLATADLVVANGLGLEGGLDATLTQAEEDGVEVLHVAEGVDPLPFGEEESHDDHEGHDHGDLDPHFWLDAARMASAAELIGARVAEVSGDQAWADCGTEVGSELTALDEELRETLAAVPEDRRTIVTDHDAFGYFTEAYDFDSAGVVVPGGSTEAEPSSQELAALAGAITDEGVPAIFSNTAVNPGLVDALAAEVGDDITVVPLYVGSTGEEGSPAGDYQGMMRENARLIVDALA